MACDSKKCEIDDLPEKKRKFLMAEKAAMSSRSKVE
jgi:hypothetical protein